MAFSPSWGFDPDDEGDLAFTETSLSEEWFDSDTTLIMSNPTLFMDTGSGYGGADATINPALLQTQNYMASNTSAYDNAPMQQS